ncbi:hypothetical protein AVEN_86757-1 [Araneus ventricosus]|uniref:Uncharacterized protein n=1 Tax=Araneus ventricosus TaxID=182803 RepID=A0A4Y2QR61_ARAVE|nr:hypothetical protein AVEN_78454-1 [Araneus ventricosus]GBN65734.1 hypothetical protein AVEN_86757-1 [Araneus ventricosus]
MTVATIAVGTKVGVLVAITFHGLTSPKEVCPVIGVDGTQPPGSGGFSPTCSRCPSRGMKGENLAYFVINTDFKKLQLDSTDCIATMFNSSKRKLSWFFGFEKTRLGEARSYP